MIEFLKVACLSQSEVCIHMRWGEVCTKESK